MKHAEASRHLAALVAGELDEPLRSTIEAHAAECVECRDWRRTFQAVSRAVAGGAASSEHPSSAELADWALDPEGPTGADRGHLDSCAGCREDLELARLAVLEARDATGIGAPAAGTGGRRRVARLAIAAACVGAVVMGGLVMRSASSARDAFQVPNEPLTGRRLITATSSIRADAVEIALGSDIIFEAGDTITLGDGFVVATGATFAAGTWNNEESSSNGT